MAVEVKQIKATMTLGDMEPHWVAEVSYGAGGVVEIPLPGRQLPTDHWSQSHRESVEAMENLARALLDFADHIRKQFPNDFR